MTIAHFDTEKEMRRWLDTKPQTKNYASSDKLVTNSEDGATIVLPLELFVAEDGYQISIQAFDYDKPIYRSIQELVDGVKKEMERIEKVSTHRQNIILPLFYTLRKTYINNSQGERNPYWERGLTTEECNEFEALFYC